MRVTMGKTRSFPQRFDTGKRKEPTSRNGQNRRRTTKSGRSDARVVYVIAENCKTFETRKFDNTRNGPRTRPPSDPVSFRRNLGVFRKRSDPCRLPPLTRHALPSRVCPSDSVRGYPGPACVPPERLRGSCPSISDRCLHETVGSLPPATTVRPRRRAEWTQVSDDPGVSTGFPATRRFAQTTPGYSDANRMKFRRPSDDWPDSSTPK